MEEAIKELVRLRKGRTIAVLGDMLELGAYAEEAHRKCCAGQACASHYDHRTGFRDPGL
jgi:UDP-N-acetylmuramyl pentapeptide synthase